MRLLPFAALGTLFGFVLCKSEVVSWYRIQEMFRFESFHLYGVIVTAVVVAAASIPLLRRAGVPVAIPPKLLGRGVRYIVGGTIFGLGWGLAGACPGPMFALVGSGYGTLAVALLSALAGTATYAWLRPRLPH